MSRSGAMGDNVMSRDCGTLWRAGGLCYFHSSLTFPGVSVGCRSEYKPDLSIQDHASGVVRDTAGETGKALRFCADGGAGNCTGGGSEQAFNLSRVNVQMRLPITAALIAHTHAVLSRTAEGLSFRTICRHLLPLLLTRTEVVSRRARGLVRSEKTKTPKSLPAASGCKRTITHTHACRISLIEYPQ